MQCNIDSQGKTVRLFIGIVAVVAGAAFGIAAAADVAGAWSWVVAAVFIVGGAFSVFQGWAGWCAVRAMGVRTRL